jgi:hypothetical protein
MLPAWPAGREPSDPPPAPPPTHPLAAMPDQASEAHIATIQQLLRADLPAPAEAACSAALAECPGHPELLGLRSVPAQSLDTRSLTDDDVLVCPTKSFRANPVGTFLYAEPSHFLYAEPSHFLCAEPSHLVRARTLSASGPSPRSPWILVIR